MLARKGCRVMGDIFYKRFGFVFKIEIDVYLCPEEEPV